MDRYYRAFDLNLAMSKSPWTSKTPQSTPYNPTRSSMFSVQANRTFCRSQRSPLSTPILYTPNRGYLA